MISIKHHMKAANVNYQANFKGIGLCALINTGSSRSFSRLSIILSLESLLSMVKRIELPKDHR